MTQDDQQVPGGLDKPARLGLPADLGRLQRQIQRDAADPRALLGSYDSTAVSLDFAAWATQPDAVIVDLGAGSGAAELRFLVDKLPFRKMYAVDIDDRALTLLADAVQQTGLDPTGRIAIVRSERTRVPLPPATADVVLSVMAPIGCTRGGDDVALLQSVWQVVKPGGTCQYYDVHDAAFCPRETVVGNFIRAGFALQSYRVESFVRQQRSPEGDSARWWSFSVPELDHADHLVFLRLP